MAGNKHNSKTPFVIEPFFHQNQMSFYEMMIWFRACPSLPKIRSLMSYLTMEPSIDTLKYPCFPACFPMARLWGRLDCGCVNKRSSCKKTSNLCSGLVLNSATQTPNWTFSVSVGSRSVAVNLPCARLTERARLPVAPATSMKTLLTTRTYSVSCRTTRIRFSSSRRHLANKITHQKKQRFFKIKKKKTTPF